MAKNFKVYDDLGVRFIYPNNWFVQTETWDKGTYGITVDSPDGSFWSLAIYPKDVDLDAAAKKIVGEMHAEYDEIDEARVKRYVADRVLTGYEINFFYLDLTSTAIALKFQDERRGYVVFWQTCDRLSLDGDEGVSRSDVFDAMTHTLVSNLTGQEVEYWDDEDDEFRFSSKADEKAQREEEEREYYRRKYEKARLSQEEEQWRSQMDEFADENDDENDEDRRRAIIAKDDETLEDFLRDAEEEYGARDDEGFEYEDDESEDFERDDDDR